MRASSAYDAAITAYLTGITAPSADVLPGAIRLDLDRLQTLRYGESPDQQAAFYQERGNTGGLPSLRQLHGKELSFNNLVDVDAALDACAP